jgi:acid phosphatase type 7
MPRRAATALTALALAAPMLAFLGGPEASAATLAFNPDADAKVQQANPTTNYGTSPTLKVDGGTDPVIESYLKFTVSGASTAVTSATLKVFTSTSTSNGPAVYGASNSWTETGVNYNTRPTRTTAKGDDKGAVPASAWVSFDVTPIVTGNGTYTFDLFTDSTDGMTFSSREGTSKPELDVTLGTETDPVIGAAGDIACESLIPTSTACHQQATANLLSDVDVVLPLGDLQYDDATLQGFNTYYDESWGSYLSISRPTVGNHEYYASSTAQGYFDYFGSRAGPRPQGYYSYSVGAWHMVSLNANCSDIDGCGPSSPEYTWLQSDLAANATECTLAYWHQPLFGTGGGTTAVKPFWNLLFAAHADVVLNGHEHHYERFAPQRPNGMPSRRGIREFVVGTGGKSLGGFGAEAPSPTSEVRNSTTFGVLKLTLQATSFAWTFVPEDGKTFTDSGSAACV